MIRTIFLLLLLISVDLWAQGETEALLQLEDKHLLSVINHDHDALSRLYDDRFHGVLASGRTVNKATEIELLLTGSPYILLNHDDVKAAVYGDIGITTGKVQSKSKTGSLIAQSRYIRIYHKKDNQWKLIEMQATVIVHE